MRRKRYRPEQPALLNLKASISGPFTRQCSACGANLRRGSTADICRPCQERELAESKTKVFGLAEMGVIE